MASFKLPLSLYSVVFLRCDFQKWNLTGKTPMYLKLKLGHQMFSFCALGNHQLTDFCLPKDYPSPHPLETDEDVHKTERFIHLVRTYFWLQHPLLICRIGYVYFLRCRSRSGADMTFPQLAPTQVQKLNLKYNSSLNSLYVDRKLYMIHMLISKRCCYIALISLLRNKATSKLLIENTYFNSL